MVALNSYVAACISNQISRLSGRVDATITPPAVSYQDVLDLFAPKELHEILRRAPKVAAVGYGAETRIEHTFPPHGTVMFNIHGDRRETPLLPREKHWMPEGKEELVAALTAYAAEKNRVRVDFEVVQKFFRHLNDTTNLAGLRYLWPSIMALANMALDQNRTDEDLQKAAERLTVLKVPSKLPSISSEMRELCRETSKTLTLAMLLGDPAPAETVGGDASLYFRAEPINHPVLGRI